jgi:hypothetical protein
MSDREQLLHLADRARRGALLAAEGALLADAVVALAKDCDFWKQLAQDAREAEARRTTERDEQQTRAGQAETAITRVRDLHQPAPGGSGGLSFNSGARCQECDTSYRCDTIRTLDSAQQPTA